MPAATDTSQMSLRDKPGTIEIVRGSAWRGERSSLADRLYEGYARKAAALRVDRTTALVILGEALDLGCLFTRRRCGRQTPT